MDVWNFERSGLRDNNWTIYNESAPAEAYIRMWIYIYTQLLRRRLTNCRDNIICNNHQGDKYSFDVQQL